MNRDEVREAVVSQSNGDVEFVQKAIEIIDGWIARGDGCAVYRNEDLGSEMLGHLQFVSYGGPRAQLESRVAPDRLPDIGSTINWRYVLIGTWEGGEDDGNQVT